MAIDQLLETAQKQAFETLTAVQDQVLSFNRSAAGTLGSALDKVPFAGMAKDAWSPAALDKTFAFAGQLLAANQKFTNELIGAWVGSAPAPKVVVK